jgi:hypothetical protein
MQAAVGRFLNSDTFKDFTERLKSGADYVTQIVKAMSVNGGTKEVLAAMGNVILAALKDGADYVGAKISEAFGKFDYVRSAARLLGATFKGAFMEVRRVARFWGAMFSGASTEEVINLVKSDYEALMRARDNALLGGKGDNALPPSKGGGNLDAALKAFSETIKENAQEYEQLHDRAKDEDELAREILESENKRLEVSERAFLSEKAAAERDKKILEKKNKKAEAEENLARLAEEIKSTEDAIKAAADREQSAREEIATAEEIRAGMLKQSISDWIAAQQEDEKGKEDVEKQNDKDRKRAARLRGRQDRGVRLSERDRDWLNKFDKRDLELREGGPLNAEAMAAQARDQQIAWQKNIEELQRKHTAVMEEIRDYLKEAVEVD